MAIVKNRRKKSLPNPMSRASTMTTNSAKNIILIIYKHMAQSAKNAQNLNALKNKLKNAKMARFTIIMIRCAKLATRISTKVLYNVTEMGHTNVIPNTSK